MRILIRQALVYDAASPHHGLRKDILVDKGIIEKIASRITDTKATKVEADNLCISPGWIDLGTYTGDPGYEYREDLDTVCAAAARGGYTGIATLPNTKPRTHSKSEIAYILNKTKDNLVTCYPLGAVSKDCQGDDLAEMYDMYGSGAVAFTDGRQAIQNGGLMLRGLLYAKKINGLVINRPHDRSIAADGHINEGIVSTTLGLKGIPDIGEHLMLQRDLALCKYTDSRYHAMHISSAESVRLIKKAITAKLNVSASVAYMNLIGTEEDVSTFDTAYKVLPPLRKASDRKELVKGLKEGTISIISANHIPIDDDHKIIEFSSAKFGASGLETCFAAINTHLEPSVGLDILIERLTTGPRSVLGLEPVTIQKGARANITLFDPDAEFCLARSDFQSKSSNSPFANQQLQGKVIGVINEKKASIF